jgi:osmotically-inducible protein OsmY
MTTDQQVQADVLAQLAADPRITASDICVSVRDGVITLAGQVDTLCARIAAGRIAEAAAGVRAVANDIAVRLSFDHARTDVDIAHDAVDALMWDTEVPDKTIKARVQDGWIWLVGRAQSARQREAAVLAVSDIPGVKGIRDLIRLEHGTG